MASRVKQEPLPWAVVGSGSRKAQHCTCQCHAEAAFDSGSIGLDQDAGGPPATSQKTPLGEGLKVAFASLRNDRSLQILEGFQESEAPIHHQSPCSPGCQPHPTLPTWEAQPSSGAPVTGPVLSPCSPLLCSPDTLPQLRDPLGAWLRGSRTCCGCQKGSRAGCK